MTRKLLTTMETQLLHPPPRRALQLGVVALHSSGVRFVSVCYFFVLVVVVLFCFSPSCPRKPDTQGERGVGSRLLPRGHRALPAASVRCGISDAGLPSLPPQEQGL